MGFANAVLPTRFECDERIPIIQRQRVRRWFSLAASFAIKTGMTTEPRDYNRELDDKEKAEKRKYGYSFDFDIMHPFMMRAFRYISVEAVCSNLGATKEISPGTFWNISMM